MKKEECKLCEGKGTIENVYTNYLFHETVEKIRCPICQQFGGYENE